MRRGHRRGIAVAVLLASACLALARQRPPAAEPPAREALPRRQAPADAPAADALAARKPALVLSASVASIDKLAAFAKKVGLGDVPFLSTTFIEQQLPFIGKGGLAPDRPLGALLYASGELDLDKLVYVLPVQPGKASLKQFADTDARPLKGRTDTVTLEGVGYRRGKDQFIFGTMPVAVAAVREDGLAATYAAAAGENLLAQVELDVAAIRRAVPGQYEQFFAAMNAEAVEAGDAEAVKTGELVTRPLRALDRLALSLARGGAGGGLRVSLVAEPLALPREPPATFARPGFPRGTIFRADLAHPPAKALGPIIEALDLFDHGLRATATKGQQAHYRALDAEFTALFLGGEAASLGVEWVDGRPVVYWVTLHDAAAPDPGPLMQSIVAHETALRRLDPRKDVRPLVETDTYAAGSGLTAHRLTEIAADGSVLCADAVVRGGTVLIALSASDGKYLDRLLAMKPEGEAAALLSGWVDLAALSAAGALPDGEEIGIGRTAMKELKAALKGQRLAWSVTPAERGARLDVDVPKALLQALAKAAGLAD